MKRYWYGLITVLPSLFCSITFYVIVALVKRGDVLLIGCWIAKNVFSDIVKEKKKKEDGKPRWLFKDIDLTSKERILNRVWWTSFFLFGGILCGVTIVFWQLLLLEESSDCDVNDPSRDCFEVRFLGSRSLQEQDPINCSSAAIQNGTTYVHCYRIVVNFGVATGASYGVFKLSMLAVNLTSSVLLMNKKRKNVQALRIFFTFLFSLASVILFVLGLTPIGLKFFLNNIVIILQTMLTLANTSIFLWGIPWLELTVLNAEKNNLNDIGLENSVAATDENERRQSKEMSEIRT